MIMYNCVLYHYNSKDNSPPCWDITETDHDLKLFNVLFLLKKKKKLSRKHELPNTTIQSSSYTK